MLATAGSSGGKTVLERLGTDIVLDHKVANESKIAELKKYAPAGLDIVVEMRADLNLATDCQAVGKNGRILVRFFRKAKYALQMIIDKNRHKIIYAT